MKRRAELPVWVFAAVVLVMLTPGQAVAYIGPGGGLSLLTTALAMLAAFSVSAVVIVTWPVRTVRRWLAARRVKAQADQANQGEAPPEEKHPEERQ